MARPLRVSPSAVLAPAVAAALVVATGWAVEHQPQAAAPPPAPLPQARPAASGGEALVDKTAAGLQRQALDARSRVAHLQRTLVRLRARSARVARSVPVAGSAVAVPALPVPRARAVAPAPRPVSRPAPASHTSTGAS